LSAVNFLILYFCGHYVLMFTKVTRRQRRFSVGDHMLEDIRLEEKYSR